MRCYSTLDICSKCMPDVSSPGKNTCSQFRRTPCNFDLQRITLFYQTAVVNCVMKGINGPTAVRAVLARHRRWHDLPSGRHALYQLKPVSSIKVSLSHHRPLIPAAVPRASRFSACPSHRPCRRSSSTTSDTTRFAISAFCWATRTTPSQSWESRLRCNA